MSDVGTNHFLIGLGGTGGKIIRSFRKIIYQNYRSDRPDGINLGYLYVDSSDSMMALDDPTWKILGRNVQLQQSSQLKIAGLNLSDVLDNVNDYPGIAPWIGNRDYFRSIIRGADAANIVGGQKRRLGRFLFACRVGQYRERVAGIVRDLSVGNTTTITFHFLAGLAGGTGSGALIDAICQTRLMFPSADYRILVYALLPDKIPNLTAPEPIIMQTVTRRWKSLMQSISVRICQLMYRQRRKIDSISKTHSTSATFLQTKTRTRTGSISTRNSPISSLPSFSRK